MFGSKNDFFKQNKVVLRTARINLLDILRIKDRDKADVIQYLNAFKYFEENPEKFDGATIVKDLVDIRIKGEYLDLDAMLHDYQYIHGANKNLKKKWKSDLQYIKNMEKNGKGIRIPRFIILTVFGFFFLLYKNIKK